VRVSKLAMKWLASPSRQCGARSRAGQPVRLRKHIARIGAHTLLSGYFLDMIVRASSHKVRGAADCGQSGEAARAIAKMIACSIRVGVTCITANCRFAPPYLRTAGGIRWGFVMSKFVALGAVFAMLAAGASAKTLKITKSERVEHRPPEIVQHRVRAEVADSAILGKHLEKSRSEEALP
jgi:hypothetical protein